MNESCRIQIPFYFEKSKEEETGRKIPEQLQPPINKFTQILNAFMRMEYFFN